MCFKCTKSFEAIRQFDYFDLKSKWLLFNSLDLLERFFDFWAAYMIICLKPSQFFTLASAHEIMLPRQILWFLDPVSFLQNFKTIRPDVRGQCSWARCTKFPFISWIWPNIALNNVNINFWLVIFNYSKHLQFKFDLSTRNPFTKINWLNIAERPRKCPNLTYSTTNIM